MTAPPAPRLRSVRPGQRLTVREREVLLMVSNGMANADIGTRLHLSEGTVKTHVRKVFAKLGASNRAHAVRLGFERGWLAASEPGVRS